MKRQAMKPMRYFRVKTTSGQERLVRGSVEPTYCVEVAWKEPRQRVVKTMKMGGFMARVMEDDDSVPALDKTRVIVFERRKEALAFRDNDQGVVCDAGRTGEDGPNGKLSDRRVSKLVSVVEIERTEAGKINRQQGSRSMIYAR